MLRSFLSQVQARRGGPCRILDLGGGARYWETFGIDWLAAHQFEVHCLNLDADELTRDARSAGPVRLIQGDACRADHLADDSYDIVHSNSVIEHVGRWPDMKAFAGEARRLAPAYYIQTPYFWFPIDPHSYRLPLIHWLPPSLQARLQLRFSPGWVGPSPDLDDAMNRIESIQMLDRQQFRSLFPDAEHRFERVLGIPKSMIATRLG